MLSYMNRFIFLVTYAGIFISSSCKTKPSYPLYSYVINKLEKDSIVIDYDYFDLESLENHKYPQSRNNQLSLMLYEPLNCKRCRIANRDSTRIRVILPPRDSVAIGIADLGTPALWLIVGNTKISTIPNVTDNQFNMIEGIALPSTMYENKGKGYFLPIDNSFFNSNKNTDSIIYYEHPTNPNDYERKLIYAIYKGTSDTIFCHRIEKCDSVSSNLYRSVDRAMYYRGWGFSLGGEFGSCK